MAAASVERRTPAKSPLIPLVLWDLTVSCELYRSAVVFIIQVGSFHPYFKKNYKSRLPRFIFKNKQLGLFLLHSCADGKWRCLHIWLWAARAARPWRSQLQVCVKRRLRNQEGLKWTNHGTVEAKCSFNTSKCTKCSEGLSLCVCYWLTFVNFAMWLRKLS